MSEIKKLLEERSAKYGEYKDNARVSQELKSALTSGASWHKLSAVQKETCDMIAQKLCRIVNGDATYEDSWIDIIGYIQLTLDDIILKNNSIQVEHTPHGGKVIFGKNFTMPAAIIREDEVNYIQGKSLHVVPPVDGGVYLSADDLAASGVCFGDMLKKKEAHEREDI